MRILFFVSGVEIWKRTPSKSDTVWSMEMGAALQDDKEVDVSSARAEGQLGNVPRKSLSQNRLNQYVLVVEEKHRDSKCRTDSV